MVYRQETFRSACYLNPIKELGVFRIGVSPKLRPILGLLRQLSSYAFFPKSLSRSSVLRPEVWVFSPPAAVKAVILSVICRPFSSQS